MKKQYSFDHDLLVLFALVVSLLLVGAGVIIYHMAKRAI